MKFQKIEFIDVLGAGVAQLGILYYEERRIQFLWHSPRESGVHCVLENTGTGHIAI